MLKAVAIELREANAFVAELHRHHAPVCRDKFRCGAEVNGRLCGVVQIARPVARHLDNGDTCEVVRLCTDGTKGACSFLYSRAARAANALGYSKIITYILETESGASLKAAGWKFEAMTTGGSWDKPSRRRATTAPTCVKQRWCKIL
jgi:hypothetical protein